MKAICNATKLMNDHEASSLLIWWSHFIKAICSATELIKLKKNTTKQGHDWLCSYLYRAMCTHSSSKTMKLVNNCETRILFMIDCDLIFFWAMCTATEVVLILWWTRWSKLMIQQTHFIGAMCTATKLMNDYATKQADYIANYFFESHVDANLIKHDEPHSSPCTWLCTRGVPFLKRRSWARFIITFFELHELNGSNKMSSKSIVSLLHNGSWALCARGHVKDKFIDSFIKTNYDLASSLTLSFSTWTLSPCTWLNYNMLTIMDELQSRSWASKPCTWFCTRWVR